MYISFDEMPDISITKEREAMFASGSNGEKLPQYIVDNKEKHGKNVQALLQTISLFSGDEPKRRLHGRVEARLEQERKWVKHFNACENEHKKGSQVAKLKVELETARKEYTKKERTLRESHEQKLEELRKVCEIENRKKFEDELKAKKKAKAAEKKNKHWYDWIVRLFKDKPKDKKPVPANNVAKQAVGDAPKVVKDRDYFLVRHADKINKIKKAQNKKG